MNHHFIFNSIFFLLIFDFVLSQVLSYLDSKSWSARVPKDLSDIYTEEKYQKAKKYHQVNSKFGIYSSLFSLVLMLAVLFNDGFAWLDQWARGFSENNSIVAMLFFGAMLLVADLLGLPFALYSTFVIEEKFGFNKTTVTTFFLDKVKGGILGGILGGGILCLIIWFYDNLGDNFWIVSWLVVSVFSIFMAMFYTTFIVPIFNKLSPLAEGSLRTAIETYANQQDFDLKNIFIIDGSKRSTKANAYFSGFGSKKTIVLYDTLISNQTDEELVAILAHEIGHYKKKHTLVSIVLSVIQTGITFYILSLMLGNAELSKAVGVEQPGFHIGILVFGMLYSPISMLMGIGMNMLSRKNEYEADSFAKNTFNGTDLISALKKLSVESLSNLTPHWLNVFLNYSHPTLLQRIEAIKKD